MAQADLSEPLLEKTFETIQPRYVVISRKARACAPGAGGTLAVLYSVFLIWQTATLFPYTIHAVHCCFVAKKLSFKCSESVVPHALQTELAMMVSMNAHAVFILWFVRKIPKFPGYKYIAKKLYRMPSYVSLILKLLVLLGSLGIVHFTTDNHLLQDLLTLTFICQAISIVALVGTLNFTRGRGLLEKYPFVVFFLFKATVFVLLSENFLFFAMVTLQMAVGVAGIENNAGKTMKEAYSVLRSAAVVMFYYQVSMFLWKKLFKDSRNILSINNDFLESEFEQSQQNWVP